MAQQSLTTRLLDVLDLIETGGRLGIFDYSFDSDSGIWSSGELRLYGLPGGSEGMSWERWRKVVDPEDYERFVAEFDAAVEERRELLEYQFRILRPDGDMRWLGGYARIEYGADARPRRMVGINRDITEKKEIERRLLEAEQRKDELIRLVTADLANATRGMRQALDVAKRQGLLSEPLAFTCAQLERGVDFLDRLAADLRSTAEAARGTLPISLEPFAFERAIDLALQNAMPELQLKDQRLAVCTPPEPLTVEGDCVRLAQVISSLLVSIARASRAGEHIALTVSAADAEIDISIAGDGDAASASGRPGPEALSLELARAVLQRHRGSIEMREAGPGAQREYWMRLPRA